MFIYKLLFSFILFIKPISNDKCYLSNCFDCEWVKKGSSSFCYCKKCNSKCNYNDCKVCKSEPNRIYYYNCHCIECTYEAQTQEEGSLKNVESSKKKNISFPSYIFIIIIVLVAVLALSYSIYSFVKAFYREENGNINRTNNNRINNINNENIIVDNNVIINNNAQNNIPNIESRIIRIDNSQNNQRSSENIINSQEKEIELDNILTNEKYLGPKTCKKEYEKYNAICTICLEKFKEGVDMVSLTPCFHLFHNKCLDELFRKNKNSKCPNCNYDIIKYYNNKI